MGVTREFRGPGQGRGSVTISNSEQSQLPFCSWSKQSQNMSRNMSRDVVGRFRGPIGFSRAVRRKGDPLFDRAKLPVSEKGSLFWAVTKRSPPLPSPTGPEKVILADKRPEWITALLHFAIGPLAYFDGETPSYRFHNGHAARRGTTLVRRRMETGTTGHTDYRDFQPHIVVLWNAEACFSLAIRILLQGAVINGGC